MSPKAGELLQRGLRLFGREELAKRLGVPATRVDAWQAGLISVPDLKYLLLLDIMRQPPLVPGSSA